MIVDKKMREDILRFKREGFSYKSIQRKLGLKSTTAIRWVLNPEYRAKANTRSLNRYYKLKDEGICPQCGKKK